MFAKRTPVLVRPYDHLWQQIPQSVAQHLASSDESMFFIFEQDHVAAGYGGVNPRKSTPG